MSRVGVLRLDNGCFRIVEIVTADGKWITWEGLYSTYAEAVKRIEREVGGEAALGCFVLKPVYDKEGNERKLYV